MARSRYKMYTDEMPYLHTCTVLEWLPVFTRPAVAQIILDALVFLQEQRGIKLLAYVIMENHIHFISAGTGQKKSIDNFKSFTARSILDLLEERHEKRLLGWFSGQKLASKKDRHYQFWQEGTHPEEIPNEQIMRQKINYVHNNPVRRGYIDDPENWRYSSARNYAGRQGLIPIWVTWA